MINAQDAIKKLTVEDLSLAAEEYFKRIADPFPQMAKPFSNLVEAPHILQNMGMMLSGLRLGKTMTVLEFAAGACWFSRYLNQLQCRTISLDVSPTALEIGQRLFREFPIIGNLVAEPIFLHFDGHKIDLPDESVDRIICHDGFHHVANQEEVLAQLARVLKSGGIAAFSEPGPRHSQDASSQYEMKNHRILENDIILAEIFALAKKHGFTEIQVKVLSDLEVTLEQYQNLINQRRDKALQKSIMSNIGAVMTGKTVFFLYKGEFVPDSRSHLGLAHSLAIEGTNFCVKAGTDLSLFLKVANTGTATWLNNNIHDLGVVKIGTHLYAENGRLLNLDFSRHRLADTIYPGKTFEQTIAIRMNEAGLYKVAVDLVSEGVCWFESLGSNLQSISIKVT